MDRKILWELGQRHLSSANGLQDDPVLTGEVGSSRRWRQKLRWMYHDGR